MPLSPWKTASLVIVAMALTIACGGSDEEVDANDVGSAGHAATAGAAGTGGVAGTAGDGAAGGTGGAGAVAGTGGNGAAGTGEGGTAASDAGGEAGTSAAGEAGAGGDGGSGGAEPDAGAPALRDYPLPALSSAARSQLAATKGGYFRLDSNPNMASRLGAWVLISFEAYRGNTEFDDQLVTFLKSILTGSDSPACKGGYDAQHEAMAMASFLLVSRIPRLWSQFDSGERHKIDLLFKCQLVSNGTVMSHRYYRPGTSELFEGDSRSIYGLEQWPKGAMNFQIGQIGNLWLSTVWLGGGAAATEYLNQVDFGKLRDQLQAAGLTNAKGAFDGPYSSGAGQLVPRTSPPTVSMIHTALHNTWRQRTDFGGFYLTETQASVEWLLQRAFSKTVHGGLNNETGWYFDLTGHYHGVIASGKAGLPNKGKVGMSQEFDTSDGGGVAGKTSTGEDQPWNKKRSNINYVMKGTPPILNLALTLHLLGEVDLAAMSPDTRSRMQIGIVDLSYKINAGYNDLSKGGPPTSGNIIWRRADKEESWRLTAVLDFFDKIAPWLQNP